MSTQVSPCPSELPPQSKPLGVHIRWMIRRDMEEILAIEREAFDCPWDEADFIRMLCCRDTIGMVAEHEGRVAGFMIYAINRWKIRLVNFCVAAELRRRRVGSVMVAKLVGKLTAQRRRKIVLEIRESNLPGQKFFRALGFKAIGIARGFFDTGEDAYMMQYAVAIDPQQDDRQCRGK